MKKSSPSNKKQSSACLITGGRVFTPFDEYPLSQVLIQDGKIVAVGKDLGSAVPPDAQRIDATGLNVAPGFIDLHTQGCCGHDVWDGTPEALEGWSRGNASHGITAYQITTGYATGGYDFLTKNLAHAGVAARPLGVYLESPFCSMAKKGGIDAARVGPISIKLLDEIQASLGPNLRMMTVAPEREGAMDLIRELSKRGIIAALGHTDCTYEQAKLALDAGITHVTHCFNTMRSIHHRDPGPIPLLLTDDRVTIELILDGHHIHPAVVAMAVRAKGVNLTCVITDNMRVAGLPEGEYAFERMGRKVKVVDGLPRLEDGTIAGSILTMDRALANVLAFTGMSLKGVLPMLTSTPAKAARAGDSKGQLKPGFDGDVVIFDDRSRIERTIVAGRTVYHRGADTDKG